jgi:DNA-binding XRE family transcriptional regulator
MAREFDLEEFKYLIANLGFLLRGGDGAAYREENFEELKDDVSGLEWEIERLEQYIKALQSRANLSPKVEALLAAVKETERRGGSQAAAVPAETPGQEIQRLRSELKWTQEGTAGLAHISTRSLIRAEKDQAGDQTTVAILSILQKAMEEKRPK